MALRGARNNGVLEPAGEHMKGSRSRHVANKDVMNRKEKTEIRLERGRGSVNGTLIDQYIKVCAQCQFISDGVGLFRATWPAVTDGTMLLRCHKEEFKQQLN
ncbi:uncharacterized protein V6R79_009557 [Siganus canaliculatus]